MLGERLERALVLGAIPGAIFVAAESQFGWTWALGCLGCYFLFFAAGDRSANRG